MWDLEWESSTLLCKNINPRSILLSKPIPSDVYNEMKKRKWLEKENVRVCFGKWQDVIPQLIQEGELKATAEIKTTPREHLSQRQDSNGLSTRHC
jgi:hypothetical protein